MACACALACVCRVWCAWVCTCAWDVCASLFMGRRCVWGVRRRRRRRRWRRRQWKKKQSFEEYCNDMASSARWGGQLELRALSEALGKHVVVYVPLSSV